MCILKETFSIENVSLSSERETIFLEIKEGNSYCQVVINTRGIYKCLKVNTVYCKEESWVLLKIAQKFSQNNISIFAFTSINHWYFFFEEKFQMLVETSILGKISIN